MLPIVATLISSGLGLLGNAVLAKGKDVIEERLGISLEESVKTEEGLFNLRKLEIEHEEFLLNLSIKQKEQELQETAQYLDDTKSARNLGVELSKSTSWLNQNIMPVLALITMLGGATVLYTNQSADVRMAVVSMMTMVLGYFFGSSKGSKDKQDQLAHLTSRGAK